MKSFISSIIAVGALGVSLPATAQDAAEPGNFDGLYIGGSFGGGFQPNDGGERIVFDRNGDGRFGDTVTTAAGGDAFAPGYCNGSATSTAPTACRNDRDGIEYKARIGADTRFGPLVVGVVGDFGKTDISDSVSAFSVTPARYTMTRSLKFDGGVRGRVGYVAGESTLFYGTGGVAYGRVRNRFSTSNGLNSFATNGSHDAWGYSAGGGVEQVLFRNISVGLEYLYTSLNDDKSRVAVGAGTAPATNPFILGGGGTTFARSDEDFNFHSIRLTAAFRF